MKFNSVTFLRSLFNCLTNLSRPYGGLRPRRFIHALGALAYGGDVPMEKDFRWVRDSYGMEFLLHLFYLIDRSIIGFGSYEPRLHKYIDRFVGEGSICMDVGANLGAIAMHLGENVKPDGQVICFEPIPSVSNRLNQHVKRNGLEPIISVEHVALSNKCEQTQMAIAKETHVNQGMSSLVEWEHQELTQSISVECMTLDHYVEVKRLQRLDFMKIDIQGAEPLLLEGGNNAFQKLKPVVAMEIAPTSLEASHYSSQKIIAMMEDMGYNGWLLDRHGNLNVQITAATTPPDFSADNVIFCPANN